MSADSQPASLLEELDRMQDEVLAELDALDGRILGLIKECTSATQRELQVTGMPEELPEAA